MAPLYYGGDGGNLGLVHALPQASFAALVKEVLGHPVVLSPTKAQFHALPKERRDVVKRTRYLTPAVFRAAHRLTSEVLRCNLIFLDVDVEYEDEAQTIVRSVPAKPIVELGSQIVNTLAPYSFAIYTTASSTPELPRIRVVVAADGIPAASYPAAVAAIARCLGLHEVTRESNVCCQPMFLPVIFSDQGPEDHPLLVSHLDGRAFSLEDLSAVDQPPAVGITSRPAPVPGETDLDHLRPPVEGLSPEEINEALSYLDADLPRKQWIDVGAALKHQFGEAGLTHWAAWSAKGSKYPGDGELEVQWRSLHPTPRGRAPVTIRSVLKLAAQAGWSAAKTAAQCFQSTMDWINAEERTPTDLLTQGVAKVVATPLLSPLEAGTLLNRLQEALRARGLRVNRSDLQKQMRAAEGELRGKGGDDSSTPDAQLPHWARGIAYVASPSVFFRSTTGQKWGPEALDLTFSAHLMGAATEDDGGRPPILPRHFLLNRVRIPRVDDFLYDPSHPNEIIIEWDRRRFLNTYRATYPEPDMAGAAAAGERLVRHVETLFGPGPGPRYLIDWMAYIVQHQGAKVLWAPLLQGAEGCGKTFFPRTMQAVLGEGNYNVVAANMVVEKGWNEWAAGTQLVSLEEIRVVGQSRHAVMDKMKELITNPVVPINQRGRDSRSAPNYANYFLCSNYKDALALTDGDRRYFVLFSRFQSKEATRGFFTPAYWENLYGSANGTPVGIRNPGAMRAFLLGWEISAGFNPNGPAPSTPDKDELIETAASPLASAVRSAIEDADHALIKHDLLSLTVLRGVIDNHHRVGGYSDQAVAAILREVGYTHAGRFRVGDERHSLWCRGVPVSRAGEAAVWRLRGEDLL